MTVTELIELAMDYIDKANDSDCLCCVRVHCADATKLLTQVMDRLVGGDLDPNRRHKDHAHRNEAA